MNPDFSSKFESARKEGTPKLLCEIALVRHESALYRTDTPNDLTAEGIERAKKLGKELKDEGFLSEDKQNLFYTSPAERAKGTMHFISEGAEVKDQNLVTSESIGPTEFVDYDAYLSEIRKLGTKEERTESAAEHYYKNDVHDDRDIVAETREDKKKRLYRATEYLIRYIQKNNQEDKNEPPKILAISHFEIITHLIDDIFGIETIGQYNSPVVGEQVRISIFETDDKDKLLLKALFRNKEKEVIFDRKNRQIQRIDN